MSVLTLADGITSLTITSDAQVYMDSAPIRNFVSAAFALHSAVPLTSVKVTATATPGEWKYALVTANARTLSSLISPAPAWAIKTLPSDYFLLSELLLNNVVRSGAQGLIDTGVTRIIMTWA